MGRTILFSPVGGTDPISNDNARDGALLHCCRVYKPDVVYMYMSSWTIKNEESDSRYSFCLAKLYERLGIDLKLERIDRPELYQVQDFNYFYDDFRSEINKIMQAMEDDDRLIINTSSGSPAMKSALVVLTTLGDIDATLIQVITPNKSINTHIHNDYDVATLWELNEDNTENFENRCSVIDCPSLVRIKNEELIKKLVNTYDYVAALDVVNMMPSKYTDKYKYLIEYAKDRLRLAYNCLIKIEKEHDDIDFLPIRNQEYRNITEYTLSLFIKKEREEYADFIRGLTPLIAKLFMLVLKNEAKIDVIKYCNVDRSVGSIEWSLEKLQSDEIAKSWLKLWKAHYKHDFNAGYVNSESLCVLIKNKCSADTFACVDRLRDVERSIRNIAAHEISIITEERVKQMTKYSSDEIVSDIKLLFGKAGITMTKDNWDSYNSMNKYITEKISI